MWRILNTTIFEVGDTSRFTKFTPSFHAKCPEVFRTYLLACGAEIDND
jgi:hypothetical protein